MFLFRYLEASPTINCEPRAIRSLQTANPRYLGSLPFSVWKNTAIQELPDPDDRLDDLLAHLCTLRWMAWPRLSLSPRLGDTLKRVINICRPHASHPLWLSFVPCDSSSFRLRAACRSCCENLPEMPQVPAQL